MKKFNYQKALDMGYTPQEIESYLAGKEVEVINKPESTPAPVSTPAPGNVDYKKLLGITKPEDIVSPIIDESKVWRSSDFGADHQGVDIASVNPEDKIEMTNLLGGVPFSGTVTDPYGYYSGLGNYYGVIGASPEELKQMPIEEKQRMAQTAQEILNRNLTNEQATEEFAKAFPGKKSYFAGHLAGPVATSPEGMATGSARMTMGSTGKSSGPHSHIQFTDEYGQPMDYAKAMEIVRNKFYR